MGHLGGSARVDRQRDDILQERGTMHSSVPYAHSHTVTFVAFLAVEAGPLGRRKPVFVLVQLCLNAVVSFSPEGGASSNRSFFREDRELATQ